MIDWSNMTFGQKVKHTRESMGISQNKLARLAGLAQSSISYLESGEKKPNLETISLIAKALDLQPSYLLDQNEIGIVLPTNISELTKIACELSPEKVRLLTEIARAFKQ